MREAERRERKEEREKEREHILVFANISAHSSATQQRSSRSGREKRSQFRYVYAQLSGSKKSARLATTPPTEYRRVRHFADGIIVLEFAYVFLRRLGNQTTANGSDELSRPKRNLSRRRSTLVPSCAPLKFSLGVDRAGIQSRAIRGRVRIDSSKSPFSIPSQLKNYSRHDIFVRENIYLSSLLGSSLSPSLSLCVPPLSLFPSLVLSPSLSVAMYRFFALLASARLGSADAPFVVASFGSARGEARRGTVRRGEARRSEAERRDAAFPNAEGSMGRLS